MEDTTIAPVYSQIALDIAMRIAKGELREKTKIHGRSSMSSEYGVSPETIRRAMKLLEDMGIVETKQNSGSFILSADRAKEYVKKFGERNDIRTYQKKLKDLIFYQESINRQVIDVANTIVRINEKFSQFSPFTNYEAKVTNTSPLIGKTLQELKFWQQTAATVIAIRREDKIILSPGPYAAIQADDTIVYIGEVNCVDAVCAFIKG